MRRTEAAHANTTPPSRITAPPSKSSADSLTEAAVSAPFATATSAANTFESPEWAREPVRAQENLPANKSGSNKSGTVNRGRRGRLDSSALLGQVAGLDAETQRRANASTRSKRVNPNDMQSLEGFYMAAWVRKVERIGEMNFPEAAHQSNSSRGPVLDVSIRADGSVQSIRIVRSSGNSELDQAAQRIVRLGAPYAAFSPELRQKYDVLSIIRPWRFEPSGQVQMR
jgi:protein TonB